MKYPFRNSQIMRTEIPIMSLLLLLVAFAGILQANDKTESKSTRVYQNKLTLVKNPIPLLNDYPEYVQPVQEVTRYEAPTLIQEKGANLKIRSWRFSYNARGVIEMPNFIRADHTAVIMVHPWGIDDGQGWDTPEPAGVADFCTPAKNNLAGKHVKDVVNPLLKRLRPHVALTMYSLRNKEFPVHKKLYRSMRYSPTKEERAEGKKELDKILKQFDYKGQNLPSEFTVSKENTFKDYFQKFPGLDSSAKYNNHGFWDLPIPVYAAVEMEHDDVVIYDADGYPALRSFLKKNEIKHVILTGYATDMCFCKTTAGYENLSADFNVFLVGDATLATFPANNTPAYATNAHISFASLNQMITQCSWIQVINRKQADK
jgi:nicotinamidase-related amidase